MNHETVVTQRRIIRNRLLSMTDDKLQEEAIRLLIATSGSRRPKTAREEAILTAEEMRRRIDEKDEAR